MQGSLCARKLVCKEDSNQTGSFSSGVSALCILFCVFYVITAELILKCNDFSPCFLCNENVVCMASADLVVS